MTTPSDQPHGDGAQHESVEQHRAADSAAHEDGPQSDAPDTGSQRRVRWSATRGPLPEIPTEDRRGAAGAAPASAAPQPPAGAVPPVTPPGPPAGPPPAGVPAHPAGAPHPGATPRPQFSWPDQPARPPQQPPMQPPIAGSEERTSVLSFDQVGHLAPQRGHDQGLGDFFADAPAAAGGPTGWMPGQPPNPVGGAQPPAFAAAPAGPDAFGAGGYNASDEAQQIVTSRRRPAGTGWRKVVSKLTFGAITPGPSAKQEQAEELLRRIKGALLDVYVVAFVNAKGGVGKTTMTVAAGSAIARERGDRVIAVDVDTDLGNLSSRFEQRGGPKANIEALSTLQDASSYPTVRVFTVQNDDRLEMLGAQNDPRSSYTLNSQDFEATMAILKKHYNVILLDCGTAITSPLFSTVAKHVDSLVVVASQDAPGLNGAWATMSWLQAHGFGRLLPRTVIALNATFKGKPLVDVDAAEIQFRDQIQGANVVRIPYDVHLAEGGDIGFPVLKPRTRKALMNLAGAVAQHYPTRAPAQQHAAQPGGF